MRLLRDKHICEEIVFLDGLSGTGKTMLAPVLGSFKRVQLGRLEHIYEYLCILDDLGKIDPDAALHMIRLYADIAVYNSMISRETNFRFADLSGVFSNPNTLEYIKRLFYKDGNPVLDRIRVSNPILHIISHQALGVMNLAFRGFGDRLRVVEMVRHPLCLLEHWYTCIDRFGTDCREFSIWLDYSGQALPWFAGGWEEKYVSSNPMDRVILLIHWFIQKAHKTLDGLGEAQRKQVLTIPFERFVLDPWPFIDAIGALLGTEPTAATKRTLKRQKCPRELVAAGPAKDIYKRYGWRKPERGASERAELEKKRAFAEGKASQEGLDTLDCLCTDYENRYGLWF